jgi:hypothetical protein
MYTKKMKKKKHSIQHHVQPHTVQRNEEDSNKGMLVIWFLCVAILGTGVYWFLTQSDVLSSSAVQSNISVATSTPTVGLLASSSPREITTSDVVAPTAVGSLNLPKLPAPAKKPVEQKTLKGQEALDYIKTLPLETQKQIMDAQKTP